MGGYFALNHVVNKPWMLARQCSEVLANDSESAHAFAHSGNTELIGGSLGVVVGGV